VPYEEMGYEFDEEEEEDFSESEFSNDDGSQVSDLEAGAQYERQLEEINNIRMHRFTNEFMESKRLEKLYRRARLRGCESLLQFASAILLFCFLVDCITLVYKRPTVHVVLYIVLCSAVCVQLALFLLRTKTAAHMLVHNYRLTTTSLGVSAFIYVVLSDTVVSCVLFSEEQALCEPGQLFWQVEDTTRVAYGMSLLFGILPFGFRIGFAQCAGMYIFALLLHILLRSLTLASFAKAGVGFVMLDSLLLDVLFLFTIMIVMLYGTYVYERNDRIVFLRMRKNEVEAEQLQNELRAVREELGWAEDEANTNEMKLEIERAKSDLDRMHPGAQLDLESWVMPFDMLQIDKRIGEGSCGEVFRGRLKASDTVSQIANRKSSSRYFANSFAVASFKGTRASLGAGSLTGTYMSSATANTRRKTPKGHKKQFSALPVNSVVAIKRIPKHKIDRKSVLSLLQETLAMTKCKHPNVLNLIGVVYDPFVCIVFEYMALGSFKDLLEATNPLANRVRRVSQNTGGGSDKFSHVTAAREDPVAVGDIYNDEERRQARASILQSLQDYAHPAKCVWTHAKTRMCVNVAAGVSYMHSRNIIHRDLKSSNLMVDSTHAVKVADLGTAREITSDTKKESPQTTRRPRPMSRVGSPLWIAPEVISSEDEYNDKADVWSFGVILCELMTHRDPYTDEEGKSHFNLLNVVDGTLSPLDFIKDAVELTPPAIVRLTGDCCKFVPSKRCSMKEALFRLLQISVEQETLKFEEDAIAAAGPYIRYTGPSRRSIFHRHGSSAQMSEENLVRFNSGSSEEIQAMNLGKLSPSVRGVDFSQRTIDSMEFDKSKSVLSFDLDALETMHETDEDTMKSEGTFGRPRPLSMATDATFVTCSSFPASPMAGLESYGRSKTMKSPPRLARDLRRPLLRYSYSTHNLGESLAEEKAKSLLSTYPSMGSIVSTTIQRRKKKNDESVIPASKRASSDKDKRLSAPPQVLSQRSESARNTRQEPLLKAKAESCRPLAKVQCVAEF